MIVTAAVVVANLLLYTAWDKHKAALSTQALADVVLVRKGISHTAIELNKIVGLTGCVRACVRDHRSGADRPAHLRAHQHAWRVASGLIGDGQLGRHWSVQ